MTDWEEALVVASGLVADRSSFVELLCDGNPRLAGECLARNAIGVDVRTTAKIRDEILKAATDVANPLTERNASAATLGRIGDPRFQVIKGASGVPYIAPQMVCIPAGTVRLGSDDLDTDAFADERPQHGVAVPAFRIGRYCVTNAEYRHLLTPGVTKSPAIGLKEDGGGDERETPEKAR